MAWWGRDESLVRLGIFGPSIPVETIEGARVVRSAVVTGWGIRFGARAIITCCVPAAIREYLEIDYDRGGKKRTVRVMSARPNVLVAAIEKARAASLEERSFRG